MIFENDLEALKASNIFSSLSESQIKLLSLSSTKISFKKNELVSTQDSTADEVFLIIEGRVFALFLSRDKNKKIKNELGKGQIFGEVDLFVDHPRMLFFEAASDVEIVKIPGPIFKQLILENADVTMSILQQMSNRVLDLLYALSNNQNTNV